jgi:4-hydroxybenzoate polyprenyltransferase
VLIATVGLYLLRYLGLFYWVMALGAILVRQAQYFAASAATSPLGLPRFDVNGLLFWVSCAALVVPCFVTEDAPEP